jgi:hypothetical protein
MNLKDLVRKDVVNDVVFDKENNVLVKLLYLPRSEVQVIMNRNTKMELNKKSHKFEEVMDGEKLTKDMARTVVKGWKGLTYRYLSTVVVLDETKIPSLDTEIDFNDENLMFLVDNSYEFGSWIVDSVRDASNFSEKKEVEIKN